MAVETAGATGAILKLFGIPLFTGTAATALGFMFMWPKSPKEAFIRIGSTILFSTIFGPALVITLRSTMPSLFEAAREVAILYGADPALGFLFIAAPVFVAAGLPAWWLMGATVRWLNKRRKKDIGELALEVSEQLRKMRGGA